MSRRLFGRGPRLAPALALVLLGGCSLQFWGDEAFPRDTGLRTGEIQGTALLPGGERPAAFAQAFVGGTSFVRRTDSRGEFTFSGLREGPWVVVVSEDLDGNGIADRRRVSSVVLRQDLHRYAPFSEAQDALTGVYMGELVLEGTVRVNGRVLVDPGLGAAPVPPTDLDLIAVVVAGRELELPRPLGTGTDPVSLGAEAKAGADATGAFSLPNVSGGQFYLLVLLYESGPLAGVPGRLVAAAPRVLLSASNQTVELPETVVIAAPGAGQQGERRSGQLLFAPPPKEREQLYLSFVPPGTDQPSCEPVPPDYAGTVFEHVLLTEQLGAVPSPVFPDLPVGLWDVRACFSDSPAGDLYAQPIGLEEPGSAPLLLGPVLRTDQQPCIPSRPCRDDDECAEGFLCGEASGRCERREPASGWFDCDGDGRRGLPPLRDLSNQEDLALWRGCRQACAVQPAGEASCTAPNDTVYDCDDDGDGLADLFEAPACYGVGRGGDADGDGLCDGIDAWPRCRDNTAEACDALREDGPQVPALYQGEGGGEGGVEAACGFERDATSELWCRLFSAPEFCSNQEVRCDYDLQLDVANCTCCTSGECTAAEAVGSFPNPFACGEEDHQVLWDFCFGGASLQVDNDAPEPEPEPEPEEG
jgi:hypothetical protein